MSRSCFGERRLEGRRETYALLAALYGLQAVVLVDEDGSSGYEKNVAETREVECESAFILFSLKPECDN